MARDGHPGGPWSRLAHRSGRRAPPLPPEYPLRRGHDRDLRPYFGRLPPRSRAPTYRRASNNVFGGSDGGTDEHRVTRRGTTRRQHEPERVPDRADRRGGGGRTRLPDLGRAAQLRGPPGARESTGRL